MRRSHVCLRVQHMSSSPVCVCPQLGVADLLPTLLPNYLLTCRSSPLFASSSPAAFKAGLPFQSSPVRCSLLSGKRYGRPPDPLVFCVFFDNLDFLFTRLFLCNLSQPPPPVRPATSSQTPVFCFLTTSLFLDKSPL